MFVLICITEKDTCIFCGIYETDILARERMNYICKNVDLSLSDQDFLIFNSNLNENIFQYDYNHGAGRLI
jgi:hypothetical protein